MPLKKVKLDMSGIPRPHRGQIKVLRQKKRFNVLACGRRWGKTTFIFILIMIHVMDNLARGLKQDIAFVGINKKNYSPVWNTVKALLKHITTAQNEQETTLRINDQFNIEFWSMEALTKSEGARGRAYRLMVVDEMGSLPRFKAVWQAILFATLNDYEGEAWFCGTPKGFNDFQEFSTYAANEEMKDDWSFYTAMSIENPTFKEKEWKMAKAQLTPEYFQQEYEAQFIALGNNLFNINDFLKIPELPLMDWAIQLRYWDIANSQKGDYCCSVRLNVDSNSPVVVLDKPVRFRGKWGQTFPQISAAMLLEPNTIHLIETEGIGSMAMEFIQEKMRTTLAGLTIYPAGREYTAKGKWDKANAWAMKAMCRDIVCVYPTEHDPKQAKEMDELLRQVSRFPFADYDDYVDSIGGAHLGVIFLKGGFGQGRNPYLNVQANEVISDIFIESVPVDLIKAGLKKYEYIISEYSDN